MGKFGIAGGGLRPLLTGLFAAGLVALTLTVAVALGMQEQEMVAAVKPTATRAVPSPTMESTPVPLPSPTAESPTAVPTQVPTEEPTETASPSPEPTPSATPRATSRPRVYASPTSLPAYVAPVVTCRKKTTWPTYVIQSGDTLYGIAGKTSSSVSQLMQANCLTSDVIPVGGILYVPRLPAKPTVAISAPRIGRFTVDPSGEISVGQCVLIRWSVTGRVTKLTLTASGAALWSGTTMAGSWKHCPLKPGSIGYKLTANGPGGATSASKPISVVSVPGTAAPTETDTPVPGPTDATSTPGGPTTAPTTVTAAPPEPTTATPTDTSVPLPTATSVPLPTATSVPLPTATSAPPPTATSAPPPTATSVPQPTATSAPPPTATSVPQPTATSEAGRSSELTGLSRVS